MKNKISSIALVVSIVSISIACFSISFNIDQNKKVAYIKTFDFMQGYQGMKDAKIAFSKRETQWTQFMDSLQISLNAAYGQFKLDSSSLSQKELFARQQHLLLVQKNAQKQSEYLANKVQIEKEKMTEGVLNQVNDFLQKYGEEEGYVVILGTNNTGTLLYAQEAIEITDEALEAINNYYKSNI